MKIFETAYAKINLGLDVLGLRADRYHEVALVMQTVGLCDTLTFTEAPALQVTCTDARLSGGADNLATRAAQLMADYAHRAPSVHIHIDKHIFLAAGLAGGSADAAAVLRGLNRLWELHLPLEKLERLGAKLGSDVPFCVRGGTMLTTGRGEVLHPLQAAPSCYVVLAKPKVEVSTPWAYRQYDAQKNVVHPRTDALLAAIRAGDFNALCGACGNVLQPVTAGRYPVITEILAKLSNAGASLAMMSGSGPTCFGLTQSETVARAMLQAVQAMDIETALTQSQFAYSHPPEPTL